MVRPTLKKQIPNLQEAIKETAWKQIAEFGAPALSLRAIARELNITAPAIYNYFPRRDDLVTTLIVDAYTSLGDSQKSTLENMSKKDATTRFSALGIAYRDWAVTYPQRYQLIFGTPIPNYNAPEDTTTPAAAWALLPLIETIQALYNEGRLRVERLAKSSTQLKSMLETWKQFTRNVAETEVLYVAYVVWSRVHGLVTLELGGQLPSFFTDPGEIFRREIATMVNQYIGEQLETKQEDLIMSQNGLHVIFGTGPLGKWTARELVRLGKNVRMVSHSGKADSRIPAEVEVVKGDAYDAQHNIEVTKGAAAVYQCAQPLYHEWVEKFPPMQKAILDAASVNGAKFIVADNLYMYGDTNGQPIREDTPYQPHTKKGKVRAAMAIAVMDAHRAGKVRAAIGRASNFFGPDDNAVTSFAIRPALEGKAINLLGRTDQPHTFSYAADFGKLLATLGTRDESLGQIWFTPSPVPVTQVELVKIMEEELGHKVKVMAAGKLMLSMLGLFMPTLRESVEMLYEWDKPFIMDSSKAQTAFGLKPTPTKQALKETLDWCKTVS